MTAIWTRLAQSLDDRGDAAGGGGGEDLGLDRGAVGVGRAHLATRRIAHRDARLDLTPMGLGIVAGLPEILHAVLGRPGHRALVEKRERVTTNAGLYALRRILAPSGRRQPLRSRDVGRASRSMPGQIRPEVSGRRTPTGTLTSLSCRRLAWPARGSPT